MPRELEPPDPGRWEWDFRAREWWGRCAAELELVATEVVVGLDELELVVVCSMLAAVLDGFFFDEPAAPATTMTTTSSASAQ